MTRLIVRPKVLVIKKKIADSTKITALINALKRVEFFIFYFVLVLFFSKPKEFVLVT